MGMPVIVEIADHGAKEEDISAIFAYFHYIDRTFSTYKNDSEMMQINRGERQEKDYSNEMKKIFALAEKTKRATKGYFDIKRKGIIDPSGIVKGYAIQQAAILLEKKGYKNFYVSIAGDTEVRGKKNSKTAWRVGVENPFNRTELIKIVALENKGIATSGTYIRGQHIYNPKNNVQNEAIIVSLTVIGPNVYEADRFATAAFAMGEKGIAFIQRQKDLEGYMVLQTGIAIFTEGFEQYVVHN